MEVYLLISFTCFTLFTHIRAFSLKNRISSFYHRLTLIPSLILTLFCVLRNPSLPHIKKIISSFSCKNEKVFSFTLKVLIYIIYFCAWCEIRISFHFLKKCIFFLLFPSLTFKHQFLIFM